MSATHIIGQDGLENNEKHNSTTDSHLPSDGKIELCINSRFTGKYKGPNWGKFNDAFEPVKVDAYDHAKAIRKGWATCPVVQGRRKKENFVSAQHLGLDFDTEDDHARLDVLEADPFIAQYGAIIHTTASHTQEKPRARVIFYLDQPVTDPDQCRRYAVALLKRFALADQKAKDPARMFFGAENCEARVLNNGGNWLPLAVLESLAGELLPPEQKRAPVIVRPPHSQYTSDRERRWTMAVVEHTLRDLARMFEGGRNDALNKAAYKFGQLINAGLLPRSEAESALVNAGQSLGLPAHEVASTVSSGLNSGERVTPDWIPDFSDQSNSPAPKPPEIQTVEYFVGEDLNYYSEGIPREAIKLLNGLHKNPWVRVDQGDAPIAKAFVALWVAWHERVIVGEHDPLQPVSIADLVRLTGLSRDTVGNALRFGEFGGFLSLYKKEDNRGKESHKKNTNTRGRPAKKYIFRPLREAWRKFVAEMELLMWRALLIEEYPELPVEVASMDNWLIPRFGATDDDIDVIDAVSQPLYDRYNDKITAAAEHLHWRTDTWVRRYIRLVDSPRFRLPEGAEFSNVVEFGDLLNELDMIEHDGERRGHDRYEIQDLIGRTAAAHRDSNKRLGIVSVPEFGYYPVTPDVDLIVQCENIDPTRLKLGRVKICAPNGKTAWVWPSRANADGFYDNWLRNNGGFQGALIQVWETSVEKYEDRLTKKEQAAVDDIRQRQAAINALRDFTLDVKPSASEEWLVAQGQMRTVLFGLQPVQNPNQTLYIGPEGEVFEKGDVWPGILQAARFAQQGGEFPFETWIPNHALENRESISPAHDDPEAEG